MIDDLEQVDYAESELRYNRFMESAYRSALHSLALPPGSTGLDAGCGPGGLLLLLDEATGGTGQITGIDISRPHLERADQIIDAAGLRTRLKVQQADLAAPLPFAAASFDWVWCADVLWPRRFPRPTAVLGEFARITKPGGTIALFFGNFYRGLLFPGMTHVEHMVQRTSAMRWCEPAESREHHERAGAWMRQSGLQDIRRSSHLVQYAAPLTPDVRTYLTDYFLIEYGPMTDEDLHASGLNDDERARWQALIDPASEQFVLDDPDYYCVQFATLTAGRTPD
jgi:ubiquinone/menaquinone biosynthesis C-methylase UbiE